LFSVVNFLQCVVTELTEVVLFSIVAFKTLVSQGSLATHVRHGAIFSDRIITIFLLILLVK